MSLQVLPLEDRTVPAVTVFVPELGAVTDASRDFADALGPNSVLRLDPGLAAPAAAANPTDVQLVDWSGTADAKDAFADAGKKLAGYLRSVLPATGRLDIHFIGQGTGAAVAREAIKELFPDDAKIGRLQFTALNARLAADDTATTLGVPYNADLADNYFTASGSTPGVRFGGTNTGTEIDLTATLQQFPGRDTDAAEVRDWYFWTVDTAGTGSYRDAGFAAQAKNRGQLFSPNLDLNKDGANDDLGGGTKIGYGQSIHNVYAPRGLAAGGLDLVFVIDTTGSMFDDIDAVKARATEILNTLAQQTTNYRVGVVLYRDFPDGSHGDTQDYQATVLVPFTTDIADTNAKIQSIIVGGGADGPESVYSGLRFATDPPAELGAWRGGDVRRSVILMGDAPPQMDEPGTGFTKTSALLRAAAAQVDVSAVATTASADAWWLFRGVADLTGGNFYFTGEAPPAGGEYGDGGYGGGGYPGGWIDDGSVPPPMPVPGVAPVTAGGSAGGGTAAAAAADSVLLAIRDIGSSLGGAPVTPPAVPMPQHPILVSGVGGAVNVFNGTTGKASGVVTPFAAAEVPNGVRTASADLNGDGVADVVAGTGPGAASHVRILDGKTGRELFAVNPFEAAFTGGVYVASGDITGDGVPDVVVTPDQGGGPRVRVYDGKTGAPALDFFGIDDVNFRGGARAAVGDVNADGAPDLVVAAGFAGGPRVAGFDGKSLATGKPTRAFADFFAFEQTLRNGVYVAVGDLDGDGFAEVVAGGGPGGGPRVTAFGGKALLANTLSPVANFFAGDPADRTGVRVAVRDLDGDARPDVVTGTNGRVLAYAATDFTKPRVEFAVAGPAEVG